MTEENKSRPATIDDLKKLVTSLNSHKVDYFLIGGYAMFTHGFHRATTDIDILVSGRAESGEKIKQARTAKKLTQKQLAEKNQRKTQFN